MESPPSGHHSSPAGHGHATRGLLVDLGWRYDLGEWFFDTFQLRGALRSLRGRVLDLAELDGADALLDVGCGTGALAIAAARRSGAAVRIAGIDPAPHQIARAQARARRARLSVDFREAAIEALPFSDRTFDRVTSTLMFHHLPPELKRQGLAEVARVLRPGGRLVLADFRHAGEGRATGWYEEVPRLLGAAGFIDLVTEAIDFRRVHRGWEGASILSSRRP